jgi:hypothetical protein
MAIGNIRQELNYPEIYRQLQGPNSGIARDMLKRGIRVQARARRNAKARTGRLRGSIEVASVPRVVSGVTTFAIIVGSNLDYAKWVHDGTGIYGPRHTLIRPKSSQYLVFPARRLGVTLKGSKRKPRMVFTPQVKGQHPNPFLKDALRAARGRG